MKLTFCGVLPLCGLCLLSLFATGCASPYYADRGAAFGGVLGAGVGAVAGAALGDPLAGAALGAVAGGATGAVAGSAMDDIEARNRAEIAARLGRPAPMGAVSSQDVIAMTHAGVSEDVIATHVRSHGMAAPLTPNDLITLQQMGVSPRVVQAMQTSTTPGTATVIASGPPAYPPPAVIIEPAPPVIIGPPPPFYRPYPYRHRYPHHHHHHHHPSVSWGVSLSSDH